MVSSGGSHNIPGVVDAEGLAVVMGVVGQQEGRPWRFVDPHSRKPSVLNRAGYPTIIIDG
jgi:hypothetical protein